ncbi:hypothetical protein F4808DRAFT_426354 [Astrocystis sublimbata]|nr:hypothetical protein F4808DRAFT_426354 [Astrocystis sublimbata]
MSVAPQDVYTGMWIDWSQTSQVLGSTITVTSSASRLLTAFLALYISLAFSYLWLLVVYSIHRARYSVTTGRCYAIIRQQQALLRAGLSPIATSIRLVKLYWAYRRAPSAWTQSWLWITISIMSAVGSVTAGLFSSQIISSSRYISVLVNSPNCGFLFPAGVDDSRWDSPQILASNQAGLTLVDLSAKYARDCYNSTSSGDKSQCNLFSSATLPWETEWQAECPFDKEMCIGPAVRLDTGLMNSNRLLGINSPTADQIGLRKITTCAPIRQRGYTELRPAPTPGDHAVTYLYGPISGANATWFIEMAGANFTQTYTMISQQYRSGAWAARNSWLPIRELNNTRGDGTIFFLSSNSVYFGKPCDDPVFSAHVATDLGNSESPVYVEDQYAGVLGCLEQFQVCSATSDVCSGVGSLGDVHLEVTQQLPFTTMQAFTADMIAFTLDRVSKIASMTVGDTPNLAASQSLAYNNLQLPVPSNQWQVEVQYWHSTVMSLIQYGILQYMVGPNDPAFQEFVVSPTAGPQLALCKRQRLRIGQGFANVSSLGLFFTISLGTVIIVVALFLDNIMGCITRLSKGDGEKHRGWIQDDVLHMQRLAYGQQQSFPSRWIGADDNIPVVEGNGFLDPIVDPHCAKTRDSQHRLSIDSLMDVDGTL